MEDRALTDLLARLLERADFHGEGRVGSHEQPDWPAGAHDLFVRMGILERASNEEGLVCDGCEEACWLVPTRTRNAVGEPVLISPCILRRDVGLLVFPPDRLVAWRLDYPGLGRALGTALGIDRRVEEVEPGWAWGIGEGQVAGRRRLVYLATGLGNPGSEGRWPTLRRRLPPDDVVVLVPWRLPEQTAGDDAAVVSLVELVAVEGGALRVSQHRLARALGGSKPPVSLGAGDERLADVLTWHASPGSRWNQVKLWLVDGDTVRLIVPGRPPRSFTAAELGLAHRRSTTRQRSKGWHVLEKLAEGHGTCALRSSGCSTFAAFKVQASELAKVLRHVVGIDGNPFFPLKEKEGLRARFQAGPLPEDEVYVGEDRWA